MITGISSSRPGAANRKTGRPMTSCGRYPKIASAALFQVAMVPSKFVLMIASFEDSTMAADDGQYLREEAIAIQVPHAHVRCLTRVRMVQQRPSFKPDPTGPIFILIGRKFFSGQALRIFIYHRLTINR